MDFFASDYLFRLCRNEEECFKLYRYKNRERGVVNGL